jgi:hypothetical protein
MKKMRVDFNLEPIGALSSTTVIQGMLFAAINTGIEIIGDPDQASIKHVFNIHQGEVLIKPLADKPFRKIVARLAHMAGGLGSVTISAFGTKGPIGQVHDKTPQGPQYDDITLSLRKDILYVTIKGVETYIQWIEFTIPK